MALLVKHMSQVKIQDYEQPWRNEEIFKKEYLENGNTFKELAQKWECSVTTVSNWADRHGVEARHPYGRDKVNYANFFTITSREHSYEMWDDNDATTQVRVHRLLAVAEYGLDAIKGKHIHHINGIEWDNRPGNIKPLHPENHTKLHFEQADKVPVNERV